MIPPRPVGPPPWLPFAPPSGLRAHFRPPGPPPPSTPPPRGPASVVNEPLLSSPPRGAQLSSRHSPSAVLLHQTVADDHGNPSPSIAPPREPPPGTPPGGSSLYLSPRLPRNTPPPPLPLTGSPAAGAESAHGNPGSIGHSLRSREIVMPAGSPLEGSPVTPLETALPHATHEASSGIHSLFHAYFSHSLRIATRHCSARWTATCSIRYVFEGFSSHISATTHAGKVSLSRQPLRGQAIGRLMHCQFSLAIASDRNPLARSIIDRHVHLKRARFLSPVLQITRRSR